MFLLIYCRQWLTPGFALVLQSAAMEETVIWEQHTVTLHRVSVYNYFIHSFLSSLYCSFPTLLVFGIPAL